MKTNNEPTDNRAPVERLVRQYCGHEMPLPQCDDACMYHCTYGGLHPPECAKLGMHNAELRGGLPVDDDNGDDK
ncbi:MAG: hypothetical protein ABL933_15840 [Methyloglobulus sp.]